MVQIARSTTGILFVRDQKYSHGVQVVVIWVMIWGVIFYKALFGIMIVEGLMNPSITVISFSTYSFQIQKAYFEKIGHGEI